MELIGRRYNFLLINRKTIGAYPILRFKTVIKWKDTSYKNVTLNVTNSNLKV